MDTWKKSAYLLGAALVLLTISLPARPVDGANILGLFTSASPSHLIVHMSIAHALAESGHNVTVVSSLKPTISHARIHHVVIPPSKEQEDYLNARMAEMTGKKNTVFSTITSLLGSMSVLSEMQFDLMKDQRFTTIYENSGNKFDLMILGFFLNDFQLAVAAQLKIPVIVSWMGPPMATINDYVGNPAEVAYVPSMSVALKAGEKMNFVQRATSFLSESFFHVFKVILNRRMENYYRQLIPTDRLPTYNDMKKNVSLAFCNSNSISEGSIRPNVPALVEIGGIQIKDTPDSLPEDIKYFLEDSEHGAILFSLGSNLQGSNIKPEIVNVIFKTLSSLKQNVIWKWEDLLHTPGKASNILYKKWLPQDDILAHPNLKLFITHAGKGGITESQYHGVPMVALPVFGDQPGNAEKTTASGYGLHLDLLQLTEETFKATLMEVLNNSTYTANVRKFSQLYRDRPMTAKQTAVFWTEYVLRHHGAAHMQSPLVHMNAFQSHNLDVVAFLCLIIYSVWRLLKFVYKVASKKFCKKCKTKNEKVKEQ